MKHGVKKIREKVSAPSGFSMQGPMSRVKGQEEQKEDDKANKLTLLLVGKALRCKGSPKKASFMHRITSWGGREGEDRTKSKGGKRG